MAENAAGFRYGLQTAHYLQTMVYINGFKAVPKWLKETDTLKAKETGMKNYSPAESQNPVLSSSLSELKELCEKENVRYFDADNLYCCGVPMYTGSGPFGPDYACCGCCGKILANISSPRINGGIIPSDKFLRLHGQQTWVRTGPHATEAD